MMMRTTNPADASRILDNLVSHSFYVSHFVAKFLPVVIDEQSPDKDERHAMVALRTHQDTVSIVFGV